MCNANYLRNYSCKHLIFRTLGVLHTMQVAKAKYQERGRRTSFLVFPQNIETCKSFPRSAGPGKVLRLDFAKLGKVSQSGPMVP